MSSSSSHPVMELLTLTDLEERITLFNQKIDRLREEETLLEETIKQKQIPSPQRKSRRRSKVVEQQAEKKENGHSRKKELLCWFAKVQANYEVALNKKLEFMREEKLFLDRVSLYREKHGEK